MQRSVQIEKHIYSFDNAQLRSIIKTNLSQAAERHYFTQHDRIYRLFYSEKKPFLQAIYIFNRELRDLLSQSVRCQNFKWSRSWSKKTIMVLEQLQGFYKQINNDYNWIAKTIIFDRGIKQLYKAISECVINFTILKQNLMALSLRLRSYIAAAKNLYGSEQTLLRQLCEFLEIEPLRIIGSNAEIVAIIYKNNVKFSELENTLQAYLLVAEVAQELAKLKASNLDIVVAQPLITSHNRAQAAVQADLPDDLSLQDNTQQQILIQTQQFDAQIELMQHNFLTKLRHQHLLQQDLQQKNAALVAEKRLFQAKLSELETLNAQYAVKQQQHQTEIAAKQSPNMVSKQNLAISKSNCKTITAQQGQQLQKQHQAESADLLLRLQTVCTELAASKAAQTQQQQLLVTLQQQIILQNQTITELRTELEYYKRLLTISKQRSEGLTASLTTFGIKYRLKSEQVLALQRKILDQKKGYLENLHNITSSFDTLQRRGIV